MVLRPMRDMSDYSNTILYHIGCECSIGTSKHTTSTLVKESDSYRFEIHSISDTSECSSKDTQLKVNAQVNNLTQVTGRVKI